MLKLQDKKPLVYHHPLNHLINSFPYVDEKDIVPQSVINYLIKSQQVQMMGENKDYLKEFVLPNTPYINSQHFENEVKRIQNKPKTTKKNLSIPQFAQKNSAEEIQKIIQQGHLHSQYNYLKNINLDISIKFGPLLFKQQAATLDKLKEAIQRNISQEQRKIEQINTDRKYQQLQNREREETIKDRIKMLLNKDQSNYHTRLGSKKVKLE